MHHCHPLHCQHCPRTQELSLWLGFYLLKDIVPFSYGGLACQAWFIFKKWNPGSGETWLFYLKNWGPPLSMCFPFPAAFPLRSDVLRLHPMVEILAIAL